MILTRIAAQWQNWLPVLAPACLALWLVSSFRDLGSTASLFALHLPVYMAHQIEEHYRPGGFRQFVNARVFHSGRDDFPATIGSIAFVNTLMVWVPIGLAALFPTPLFALGAAMFGVTLVNSVIHIAAGIRLRGYNPGLVTAIIVLLPISLWFFATRLADGEIGVNAAIASIVAGLLLHGFVASIFILPYLRAGGIASRRRAEPQS